MKMEWMGEYRDVVEALIHYCNIYADVYKNEHMVFQDVTYSFSQVQVLEYLLENEERQDNMSAIAHRLGISRSNFTKIVNRLATKGLVEKSYMQGSKKELTVSVNDFGKELYIEYSQRILKSHFQPMFQQLKNIPRELYPYITGGLYDAMHRKDAAEGTQEE
jgi:DNA-binding MarR family transcriptional regulator